ncbi:hypothetical protein KGQ64_03955 [bacterium]|nr:hypothetical protein [bacterium]
MSLRRGPSTSQPVPAILACALALVATVAPASAQRPSGTQLTPDARRYLVNKDVGGERWAISFDLDDRTVTGNVFKTDGSPPSFVWCRVASETQASNPGGNAYSLDCWGAPACAAAPCSNAAWTEIGRGIPIAGSFLLPPGTAATWGGAVAPVLASRCALSGCHDGNNAANGLDLRAESAWRSIVGVASGQDAFRDLVEPFDPDASYLLAKILGDGILNRMPLGQPPLDEPTTAAIRRWIEEGAAKN